jgi:site-specific recombinase XerD
MEVLDFKDHANLDIKKISQVFKEYLKLQEKSKNTIKSYLQDLKTFYQWWTEINKFDHFRPAMIHKQDIIDYKEYLQEELNYSPSTINRKVASLKVFFRMCVGKDYIKSNPAKDINFLDQQENSPKSLTEEQKRALLEVINRECNSRDRAIMAILMTGGFKEKSGLLLVKGKGNKYRRVPVPQGTVNALRNYLATRLDNQEAMFLSNRNKRIAYDTLRSNIANLFKIAKIGDATIHTLRHTAARDMIEKHNINDVAKILGHSAVTTTQIYLEPRDEDLKKVTDSLDYF